MAASRPRCGSGGRFSGPLVTATANPVGTHVVFVFNGPTFYNGTLDPTFEVETGTPGVFAGPNAILNSAGPLSGVQFGYASATSGRAWRITSATPSMHPALAFPQSGTIP